MGIEWQNGIKMFIMVNLFGTLAACVLSCLVYLLWVYVGELSYPMPFHGYIVAVLTWNVMIAAFWFQCLKVWRANPVSRKKMGMGILMVNMFVVVEFTYKLIRLVFVLLPIGWHVPLVLILILVRELHVWIVGYVGQKIAGFPDLSVEIIATLIGALRHTMFLSVDIGSITSEEVAYSILAADFLINLSYCFVVLWYNQNGSEQSQNRTVKATLSLIVSESVEILMPISYTISLLMAYYGPNGELLGNIRNSSWQYSAIEDLDATLTWLGMMFSIDFGSAIISITVLWKYCKINVLDMYLRIQKEMWFFFAVSQAYFLTEVEFFQIIIFLLTKFRLNGLFTNTYLYFIMFQYFFQCPISFAIDYTFEFKWLSEARNGSEMFQSNYSALNTSTANVKK
jgi:hypothetical protein